MFNDMLQIMEEENFKQLSYKIKISDVEIPVREDGCGNYVTMSQYKKDIVISTSFEDYVWVGEEKKRKTKRVIDVVGDSNFITIICEED